MREGLYIETDVDKIVGSFFVDQNSADGKMLVILGSAGDGKSALLVNWNKRARESGVEPLPQVHLDATASFNPHEQYDITLNNFLEKSSENMAMGQGPRSAMAINLGLAINFFETRQYKNKFPSIWSAINDARTNNHIDRGNITILNLSRRQMFDARPEHLGEGFLLDIINKFDFSDTKSPFHAAFEKERASCHDESECILLYNATKFTNPEVRRKVAKILAARSIINGTHLNPRLIIHMVSSIMLHPRLRHLAVEDGKCPICHAHSIGNIEFRPEEIIWNSLFEQDVGKNHPLSGLLDPLAQINLSLDFHILELASSTKSLGDDMKQVKKLVKTAKKERQEVLISTLLRSKYLTGDNTYKTIIEDQEFIDFLGLYCLLRMGMSNYKQSAGNVNSALKKALRCWAGSVDESHLVRFTDGYKTPEFEFMSKWEEPKFSTTKSSQKTKESHKMGMIWMVLEVQNHGDRDVAIPLTFDIYQLMQKVIKGYNPSSIDMNRSEGIQLIASRLSDFTTKNSYVQVVEKDGDHVVDISVDELDTIRIGQVR